LEKGYNLLNHTVVVQWNTRKLYLQDLARLGVDIVPTLFLSNVRFFAQMKHCTLAFAEPPLLFRTTPTYPSIQMPKSLNLKMSLSLLTNLML
jgi:hypothetical protein